MEKIIVSGRSQKKNPNWMESLSGTGAIEDIQTFEVFSSRGDVYSNTIKIDNKDSNWSEITFSDESTWIGKTHEISSLFDPAVVRSATADDGFTLPTYINNDDTSRGLFSKLKIEFISFFKTKATNVALRELAFIVDQHFVHREGTYEISSDFDLKEITEIKESNKPYLLLLHGTISNTKKSFSDLSQQSNSWKEIHEHYDGKVIGFEHHTLTKGPLQNALQLIQRFPDNIELHILSHSRGGFIGDIISRFDPIRNKNGFTYDEIDFLTHDLPNDFDQSASKKYVDEIKLLREEIHKKNIKISKYVRVACPASGTSILSQNLNFFFNVFNNLTRITGTPGGLIASKIGGVILQIIKSIEDPNILPGLEVMRPESKLNIILNNPHIQTSGGISVISSNSSIQGGLLKGLAYVLTRLIFWENNDFVVNTPSMFNGLRRTEKIRNLHIEGSNITHISYFAHKKVQKNLLYELTDKIELSEFSVLADNENNRGAVGLAWGRTENKEVDGKADIVIVLPGIMGSALASGDDVIWLDYLQLATGGFSELNISKTKGEEHVQSIAAIKTSYQALINELHDAGYQVEVAHYDWRKSIAETGSKFKNRLEELISMVAPHGNSIKIVAHSMGGLVVRDIMVNHKQTYHKLSLLPDFKFLMLGTPWKGSLLILQLLAGQGKIFSSLNRLALFESKSTLIKIFANLPGVLDLLPLNSDLDRFQFENRDLWLNIKNNLKIKNYWHTPDETILNQFGIYKKEVIKKLDEFGFNFRNVIYVAGKADETVNNYYFDENKKPTLRFTGTAEGDGSVTWDEGIPDGVEKTYYVDVSHGDLSSDRRMMKGIIDMLNTGRTDNSFFKSQRPTTSAHRGTRDITPYPHVANDVETLTATAFGSVPKSNEKSVNESQLKVKISCGNLIKADYPVLVGHIKGPVLMGAEKAVDRVTDQDLTRMLHMGLFPNEKYMSEILVQEEGSRFKGAIIVGIGDQDRITGHVLELSIEKAALKYAMFKRRDEHDKQQDLKLQLSSVLISSHYGRVNIDTSLESLIKGIQRANQILVKEKINVQFDTLEIIEIYEDKSEHAFLLVKALAKNSPDFNIEVHDGIAKKSGARLRLPLLPGDEWYQRYTVTLEKSINGHKKRKNSGLIKGLIFQSDSGLARVEKIVDYTNHHTIESIIRDIPTAEWNKKLSKALFEMLIPNGFKSNIKRQPNILLELDEDTAGYPWEMMTTEIEDQEPISIRSSMIRRFSTMNYVRDINFITKDSAFILGNPRGNPKKYPDLPGAKEEAKAVAQLLTNEQYDITYDETLLQRPSEYIIDLLTNEYKIIHISAHGDFDRKNGFSKIITGPNKYDVITTGDLCKMTYTPELAFINCCFLGDVNAVTERKYRDRHKIAASIGVQLLNHGYKMVIVAGWAVDDQAAKVFAVEFYKRLLSGENFGDSVKAARQKCFIFDRKKNTWGAYHCYGNPDYTLSSSASNSSKPSEHHLPIQAKIEIRDFMNDLEKTNLEQEKLVEKMEAISTRINNSSFQLDANILELEALCYAEILDWDKAKELFTLLKKGKSNFTFKSMEKFANIMARAAYRDKDLDGINEAIKLLTKLQSISDSSELNSLKGSANKRIYALYKNNLYLKRMTEAYEKAFSMSSHTDIREYHYALVAYLIGKFFLTQKRNAKPTIIKTIEGYKTLTSLIDYLEEKLSKIKNSGNFWDESAIIPLCQYLLISTDDSAEITKCDSTIRKTYKEAWKLGGTEIKKATEIDQIDFLIAGLEDLDKPKVKVQLISEKIQTLVKLKEFLNEDLKK